MGHYVIDGMSMIYIFKSSDHFKRLQCYLNTLPEKVSFNLVKNYEEDLINNLFCFPKSNNVGKAFVCEHDN